MTSPKPSPGSLLKGRYAVTHRFGPKGGAFVGQDRESGAAILLVGIAASSAAALARGALVGHPHLATLLDVVDVPGGAIGVFEFLPGRTLEDVLADQGTLPETVAVTCAYALVDALGALHRRLALHGQIRPLAVIVGEPPQPGPWLSRASASGHPDAYQRPEHDPASPVLADDVWAMGALLHHMLFGFPPPVGGYASAAALPAGTELKTATRDLLANTLATDPERRIRSAQELKTGLARLEPRTTHDQVAHETIGDGGPSDAVSSLSPHAASKAPGQRPHYGPLLVSCAVLGIMVAAWLHLKPHDARLEGSGVPASAGLTSSLGSLDAAPRPAPDTVTLGSLPSDEGRAACITRELRVTRLIGEPQLEQLCTTRDPRKGSKLLTRALKASSIASDPSRALFKSLGEHRMVAFAILRMACCHQPEPLALGPGASSGALATTLDGLAKAVVSGKPHASELGHYRASIGCASRPAEECTKSWDALVRWLGERKAP